MTHALPPDPFAPPSTPNFSLHRHQRACGQRSLQAPIVGRSDGRRGAGADQAPVRCSARISPCGSPVVVVEPELINPNITAKNVPSPRMRQIKTNASTCGLARKNLITSCTDSQLSQLDIGSGTSGP